VWPTLAVGLAFCVLVALGTWQLHRLAWKQELIATVEAQLAAPPAPLATLLADPPAAEFRRVRLRGHYLHDRAFAFGAFAREGELGAHIVTPLATDLGLVLVERGWLPEPLLPPATPADLLPEGEVELSGVARFRGGGQAHLFTPANRPAERRWFWWDLPAMAGTEGAELLPLVVTLDVPDTAASLPRVEPARPVFSNNHLGYAITWYGLALALLAVYVARSLESREPSIVSAQKE
jgi:surfeit locus 1 family protein